MAQQCLILSVIFAGITDKGSDTTDALSADRAAAVFLFLLFGVYVSSSSSSSSSSGGGGIVVVVVVIQSY